MRPPASAFHSALYLLYLCSSVPIVYHFGFDAFDTAPLSSPTMVMWTGSVSQGLRVDPNFPITRVCSHPSMPYAGRLANGSYFIVAAPADATTTKANLAPSLNMNFATWSTATQIKAFDSMTSIRPSTCNRFCAGAPNEYATQVIEGPVVPALFSWSAFYGRSKNPGCSIPANVWLALVRTDGSVHWPMREANFQTDRPVTYGLLAGAVRTDVLCFTFTSIAPSPKLQGTTLTANRPLLRCIGSQSNPLVVAARMPAPACNSDSTVGTQDMIYGLGHQFLLQDSTSFTNPSITVDPSGPIRNLAVAETGLFMNQLGIGNGTDRAWVNVFGCPCRGLGTPCGCTQCTTPCTSLDAENVTSVAVSPRGNTGAGYRCGINAPDGRILCSGGNGANVPSYGNRSLAAMSSITAADGFFCSIVAADSSLVCTAASATLSSDLRTALTAQGFSVVPLFAVSLSVFAAGGATARFSKLDGGNDTMCGVYTLSTSSSTNRVACWGALTNPSAAHTILRSAFSGVSGGSIPTALNSALGSLADVSVSATFACALGAAGTRRLLCWGAVDAASIAVASAANLSTIPFSRIAATSGSVCGVTTDSRLQCIGGLSRYVVSAVVNDPLNITAGTNVVLSPTETELILHVGWRGTNDTACGLALTDNCTSMGAALRSMALWTAANPWIKSIEIRLYGRISMTRYTWNPTPVVPVVRFSLVGFTLPYAPFDPPSLTFTGGCSNVACFLIPMHMPSIVRIENLAISVAGVVYTPRTAAQLSATASCASVFSTAASMITLRNVRFTDIACTMAVFVQNNPTTTAPSSRYSAATNMARLNFVIGTPLPLSYTNPYCETELSNVLFARVAAPYGFVARTLTGGMCASALAFDNSTFASAIMLDKALAFRADRIYASSVSGSLEYPNSPTMMPTTGVASSFLRLANLTRCGSILRLNSVMQISVADSFAKDVTVGGAGGGAFACVTDDKTYFSGSKGIGTGAEDARPPIGTYSFRNISLDSVVTVDDDAVPTGYTPGLSVIPAAPQGGGAGIMIRGIRRGGTATLADITAVNCSANGDGHSGGAIGIWTTANVTVTRLTCNGTAAPTGAGGCVFFADAPNSSIVNMRAQSSWALDGGGALAMLRSTVDMQGSHDFSDCFAVAGPGGAILLIDSASTLLSGLNVRSTQAAHSHGGAIAVAAGSTVATFLLSIVDSRFTGCYASERGGAISVLSAADSSVVTSLTFARLVLNDCWLASGPALVPGTSLATSRPFVGNGYSRTATGTKTLSAIQGGGGISVLFMTADSSAQNATAVAPVGGAPGNTGVALPEVNFISSVLSNITALVGDGGAILLSRSKEARMLSRAQVNGVIISGCTAAVGSGGGFYVESSALGITDSIIANNTAAVDGGGIFTRAAALTSVSVVVAQNVAGRNGGGIASENCPLTGLALLDQGVVEVAAVPSVTPSVTAQPSISSSVLPSASGSATVSETPPPWTATVSSTRTQTGSASVTKSISSSTSVTASVSTTLLPSATVTPQGAIAVPPSRVWSYSSALGTAQLLALALANASFSIYDGSAAAQLFAALRGIHIVGNGAVSSGGGVAASACNVYLGGAQVTGNVARDGGGMSVAGKSTVSSCVSSFTGNMALGAAAQALRYKTGTSAASAAAAAVAPSSADALFSRTAAMASANMRGDASLLSLGQGGAIAVLEPEADVDICSGRACENIARLSRRGIDFTFGQGMGVAGSTSVDSGRDAPDPNADGSGEATDSGDADTGVAIPMDAPRLRVPLSMLWPYLYLQAGSAVSLFGRGEAYSRIAVGVPRGLSAAAAAGYSRVSASRPHPSLQHNQLPQLSWPLKAADYAGTLLPLANDALSRFAAASYDDACVFGGNFAAGSGGDIAVSTIRDPADVGSAYAGTLFLSRLASIASHADGGGGSVSVRTLPLVAENCIFVQPSSGKGAAQVYNGSVLPWSSVLPVDTSSSTWDGSLGGFGGAIALRGSVAATIVNSTVVSPYARAGGVLWAQPPPPAASSAASSSGAGVVRSGAPPFLSFNASAAADAVRDALATDSITSSGTAVSVPQRIMGGVGGILLSGLVVTNSSAVGAGGWMFAAGGSAPDCVNCALLSPQPRLTASLASNAYGPVTATLPVRLVVNLTSFGRSISSGVTVPGRDFTGITGITVTSTANLLQAPFTVTLLDALNATVTTDFTTSCAAIALAVTDGADIRGLIADASASGVIGNERATLPLVDASVRYVAQGGVVSVAPIGLSAAPGQAAAVAVRCTVSYAGDSYTLLSAPVPFFIRKLELRIAAVPVLANGTICEPAGRPQPAGECIGATAVPLAQPLPAVASTAGVRYPPDWAVWVAFVELDGSVSGDIPPLACKLSVLPDARYGSSGAGSRVLSGEPGITDAVQLVNGSGRVRPLLNGPAGGRILISAACSWMTGESIASSVLLEAIILRPRLVWQLDAVQGAGMLTSRSLGGGVATVSRSQGGHPLLSSLQSALGAAFATGSGLESLASAATPASTPSLRTVGLAVAPAGVAALNLSAAIANSGICGAACAGARSMPAGSLLGFRGGVTDVDGSRDLQATANTTLLLASSAAASCALAGRVLVKPRTFMLAPVSANGESGSIIDRASVSAAPAGVFGVALRPGSPSSGSCSGAVSAASASVPSNGAVTLSSPDAALVLDGDLLQAYATGAGGVTLPQLSPDLYASLLGRLPSALSSSIGGATLVALDPPPSLLVVADDTDASGASIAGGNSSGIGVVLARGNPTCSVRLVSATAGPGVSLQSAAASPVGDMSPVIREEDGSITFARLGVAQAAAGTMNLFLTAVCVLPSGHTATSPPLPILLRNVTAGFDSGSVPLVALASAKDRPVPLSPQPTMLVRETVQLPLPNLAALSTNVSVALSGSSARHSSLRTFGSGATLPTAELPFRGPTSAFAQSVTSNATLQADFAAVLPACTSAASLPSTVIAAAIAIPANGSTIALVSGLSAALPCLAGPLAVAASSNDATVTVLPPPYIAASLDASVYCSLGAATVTGSSASSVTAEGPYPVAGGSAALPSTVGVVGGLGTLVSLTLGCQWLGQLSLASSSAFLLAPLATNVARPPPPLVYPSSKVRGVIPMTPPPVVELLLDTTRANALLAQHGAAGGPLASVNASAFSEALVAASASMVDRLKSSSVLCSLEAWGSSAGSEPQAHQLIDPAAEAASWPVAETRTSSLDGRTATFTIGVRGPLAGSFKLNASCGWLSGETVRAPGWSTVKLPALGGYWPTPLPPVLLSSSEISLLPIRAPLQLQLLQWNTSAEAAAFAGGSAGVSPAASGAVPLAGFTLSCSLLPLTSNVIILPPVAAADVAVSSSDGSWSSASFGLKAPRAASACLRASCTWPNGEELPIPSTCAYVPAVAATWCASIASAAATAAAGAFSGSPPLLGADDCSALLPLPSEAVYNEPIPDFGLALQATMPYSLCTASPVLVAALRDVASAAANASEPLPGANLTSSALQCAGLMPPAVPAPTTITLPWRLLGATSRTGRCAVRADRRLTGSATEPLPIRGATSSPTDAASGVSTLTDLALTPSAAQVAVLQTPVGFVADTSTGSGGSGGGTTMRPVYLPLSASVTAECFINEIAVDLPLPSVNVSLPTLAVGWLSPFPASVLPAAQSDPEPLSPAVTTAIVNINEAYRTGPSLTPLPITASCSLRLTAALYPPLALVRGAPWFSFDPSAREPDTGRVFFNLLVGTPTRPLVPGSPAVFSDLAIAATMGSLVTIEATCLRAVGGSVKPQVANVSIKSVFAEWTLGTPPAVLTDKLYPVSLVLYTRVLAPPPASDPSAPWTEVPGSRARATAGITCALSVRSTDGSLSFTPKATVANESDGTGAMSFVLDFTTRNHDKGIRGAVQATCLVNGQTVYSPPQIFRVHTVYVRACVPAPLVWLPSEGSARMAIKPAPSITLSTEPPAPAALGASPGSFFGDGGYCPGVQVLPNGELLIVPLPGQVSAAGNTIVRPKIAASYFGALNSSFAGAVASGSYILDPAQDGYSLLSSQDPFEPVIISNLFLTARYGTLISLSITCRRDNGEQAVPLTLWIRIVHPRLDWGVPMPASARPGVPFNVSLLLRDDYGALMAAHLPRLVASTLNASSAAGDGLPLEERSWLRDHPRSPTGDNGSSVIDILRATFGSLTAGGASSPTLAGGIAATALSVATTWTNMQFAADAQAVMYAYSGASTADIPSGSVATAASALLPLPRSIFATDPWRNDSVSICRLIALRVINGTGKELGRAPFNDPGLINMRAVPPVSVPGADDDAAAANAVALKASDISTGSPPAGILLQGAEAYVRTGTGAAAMPAIAISSRLGTIVEGVAVCATGTLPAPAALPWRVAMSSCGKGEAPDAGGMTCSICGNGLYSDGGAGADKCVTCPAKGVVCTAGIINLLPGFFRADKQDTINADTELHTCWFPEGCVVNTQTSSRRWNDTHTCAEGYSGPLCALCDPNGGPVGTGFGRQGTRCLPCMIGAGNAFVVAIVAIGLIGLGFFVANRRLTEVNPRAPLVRIIISHVQTLGSLLSDYVAKGTESFKQIFAISEVAGSSPLALQPIQCALRLGFYQKFVITLLLPLFLVGSVMFASFIMSMTATKRFVACLRRRVPCCRSCLPAAPAPSAAPQTLPSRLKFDGPGAAATRGGITKPGAASAEAVAASTGKGKTASNAPPPEPKFEVRTRSGRATLVMDNDDDPSKALGPAAGGSATRAAEAGSDSEEDEASSGGRRVAFTPASSSGAGGGSSSVQHRTPGLATEAKATSGASSGSGLSSSSGMTANPLAKHRTGESSRSMMLAAAASAARGTETIGSVTAAAKDPAAADDSAGAGGAGRGRSRRLSNAASNILASQIASARAEAPGSGIGHHDDSNNPAHRAAPIVKSSAVTPMVARGGAGDMSFWRGQQQAVIETVPSPDAAGDRGVHDGDASQRGPGCCDRIPFMSRLCTALRQPRVLGPSVFVVNLSYMNVMSTAFSAFSCYPLKIAQTTYLSSDFGVECGTPTHFIFQIISGVVMLTFGLGIPIGFAMLLKRNKHRLYEPAFFASFSFLYDGLSVERGQQSYDVKFAVPRKAIIVLIGNVLKDSVLQLLAGALLILFALIVLLVLQPYAQPLWNVLESTSLATILVTILATLAFVRAQSNVTVCTGYADNIIPPGAEESCGASRAFLAKMDVGATAALIAINALCLLVFAFVFVRLAGVQQVRNRIRIAGSAGAALAGIGLPPTCCQRLIRLLTCRCCCRDTEMARVQREKRRYDGPPLSPDQVTDQALLILDGSAAAAARPRKGASAVDGPPPPTLWQRMTTPVVVLLEIPLHLACERAEQLTAVVKAGVEAEAAAAAADAGGEDSPLAHGPDAEDGASGGGSCSGTGSGSGSASTSASVAGQPLDPKRGEALRFAASSAAAGVLRSGAGGRAGAADGGTGRRRRAQGDAASASGQAGASSGAASQSPRRPRAQHSLFAVAAARRRNMDAFNTGEDDEAIPGMSSVRVMPLTSLAAVAAAAAKASAAGSAGGGGGQGIAGASSSAASASAGGGEAGEPADTSASALARGAFSGGVREEARMRAAMALKALNAFKATAATTPGSASGGGAGGSDGSSVATGDSAAGGKSPRRPLAKKAAVASVWRLAVANAAADAATSAQELPDAKEGASGSS